MYRYTTPTHTFTMPADTSSYSVISVAYKQDGYVLKKKYVSGEDLPDGMALNGNAIIINLTQEETSKFHIGSASVQVRALTPGGKATASVQFPIQVYGVIDEEVFE